MRLHAQAIILVRNRDAAVLDGNAGEQLKLECILRCTHIIPTCHSQLCRQVETQSTRFGTAFLLPCTAVSACASVRVLPYSLKTGGRATTGIWRKNRWHWPVSKCANICVLSSTYKP